MLLNRELVCSPVFQRRADVLLPDPALLELPEKAVQFGTGAFLRGFVEYFLDEANRRGCFGGRVVAVGSTGSGRDQLLNRQDGLFTLSVQGMVDGVPRQEQRIIGSLSRCISARTHWPVVLECARNPDLELIFSNTTEVGIELDESDAAAFDPPRSFPGKLTRFLYERARTFAFAPERGVVVLPCELIEDNGDRLRSIVLTLAEQWKLEADFARWLCDSVTFCNTLVDRIVSAGIAIEERILGYRDDALTTCEPYRLLVIQGDASLQKRLRFADADAGILVTPHIEAYRERKVGLLNATHTIMVPLAMLCGFETVADATQDAHVGAFVRRTMLDEIAPGLDVPDADGFAREVLDRFANPFVRHALFDITLQGTMKMRVRVVPSIVRYAQRTGRAPSSLAFGFAAYLLFMRSDLQDRRQDDQGARVYSLWRALAGDHSPAGISSLVRTACADESLWGTDLGLIPGFVGSVSRHLICAQREGISAALAAHLTGETAAVA